MKAISAARPASDLPEHLHRRLNTYSLAASAAGVGVLALAHAAEAKIVYTPAHVRIVRGQPPFPLDLNHDGLTDFYLFRSSSGPKNIRELEACQSLTYGSFGPLCRVKVGSNQVRASAHGQFEAALRYGAKIQSRGRFVLSAPLGGVRNFSHSKSSSTFWFGPWLNGGKGVKNRYLGLKFKIRGKFHFGWARLTVTTTKNDFTAVLTGYAYETIPGKAIIAGQTEGPASASLGALAAGAQGVRMWRPQP